jgi:hypothetical protein
MRTPQYSKGTLRPEAGYKQRKVEWAIAPWPDDKEILHLELFFCDGLINVVTRQFRLYETA